MKQAPHFGILSAILAVLIFAVVHAIRGPGKHAPAVSATVETPKSSTESRTISAAIKHVVLNGPIDVNLRAGSRAELRIDAPSNVIGKISTEIQGDTLTISTNGTFVNFGNNVQVEVTLPELEQLEQYGSGDIDVQSFRGVKLKLSHQGAGDLTLDSDYEQIELQHGGSGELALTCAHCKQFKLESAGSGDITLHGQSAEMSVETSGSGDLEGSDFTSETLRVRLAGSGNVDLGVSKAVKAVIVSSGNLDLYGNPNQREIQQSGSGDVTWH